MFSKISSVINWINPGQQQFSYIMFVSKVRTYPCEAPFRQALWASLVALLTTLDQT